MLRALKNKIKSKLVVKEVYTEKIQVSNGKILKDRVALITGASEGIGYGIADIFKKQAAKVIITGRNEEKLVDACKKLEEGSAYMVWDAADISCIEKN